MDDVDEKRSSHQNQEKSETDEDEEQSPIIIKEVMEEKRNPHE